MIDIIGILIGLVLITTLIAVSSITIKDIIFASVIVLIIMSLIAISFHSLEPIRIIVKFLAFITLCISSLFLGISLGFKKWTASMLLLLGLIFSLLSVY